MRTTTLIRSALPFLAAGTLAACSGIEGVGGPPSIAVGALSSAILVATDRTITDHLVSRATGEDCSLVAYLADGHYCRPHPEAVRLVRESLYCYRTLADVDCHTVPNPFGGNPPPVGTRFSREVAYPASEGPAESAARAAFR